MDHTGVPSHDRHSWGFSFTVEKPLMSVRREPVTANAKSKDTNHYDTECTFGWGRRGDGANPPVLLHLVKVMYMSAKVGSHELIFIALDFGCVCVCVMCDCEFSPDWDWQFIMEKKGFKLTFSQARVVHRIVLTRQRTLSRGKNTYDLRDRKVQTCKLGVSK